MNQWTGRQSRKPEYSAVSNIVWVLRLQSRYARLSLILLLWMIPVQIGIQFLEIYLPKQAVADVLSGVAYSRGLLHIGILLTLLLLLSAASKGSEVMKFAYCGRFREEVRYHFILKTMTVPYMTVQSPDFRNKSSQAQKALWASGIHCPLTQLSQEAADMIRNLSGYLLFGATVTAVSPWILLILTVTPVFGYLFSVRYNRYVHANRGKWSPLDRQIEYVTGKSRNFDTAKDIRIYGLNSWFVETYQMLVKQRLQWDNRLLKKSLGSTLADLVGILIRDGGAYAILIIMTLRGEVRADEFIFYFGIIGSFAAWTGGILNGWKKIHSLSLKLCDLREILEIKEESSEKKDTKNQPAGPCSIELRNLSFHYEGAEQDALSGINLKIRPGEKLAIVGLNGAGKTTLIKNICGLYLPTGGEILVGGMDSRQFILEEYYELFSVVFQDFNILCVSIAQIVSSACDSRIDRKKVRRCLELAGLWEKISKLADGMDTPLNQQVYPNGVNLSGGEWQKLLLAKAIYKEAPILILDEPTASLDPIAENQMYLRYQELTRGRTSIFISHRLSSTRFCDRILYLEAGRIAEQGTHEELIRLGGKYASLFEMQSRYYQTEPLAESVGERS